MNIGDGTVQRFPAERAQGVRVLVLGDVMLDRYWFGDVERISPEAPVPVVQVGKQDDRLGGAANVARNIMALGARATLVGMVGDDDAGRRLQALVQQVGIDARLVEQAGAPTTLKLRVLSRQQQLLRLDFETCEGRSGQWLLDQVAPLLSTHDLVVLSDYGKGMVSDPSAVIAAARQAGLPVLVDPKGRDYGRYRDASIITPNRAELTDAVGPWDGEQELAGKADALRRELRLEALLVTRSEQGMTLFTEAGRWHADTQAHEVFDVSGAGDTVMATLAVGKAAGLDWQHAAAWANRAGGVVVGKLGTSVVTAQELV